MRISESETFQVTYSPCKAAARDAFAGTDIDSGTFMELTNGFVRSKYSYDSTEFSKPCEASAMSRGVFFLGRWGEYDNAFNALAGKSPFDAASTYENFYKELTEKRDAGELSSEVFDEALGSLNGAYDAMVKLNMCSLRHKLSFLVAHMI